MALIEKLTAIGDKIRERLGATDLITLSDMPDEIDEVCRQGEKSAYDKFWDDFQQNGNRTAYMGSFGCGWKAEIFNPKYSMRPISADRMFFNNHAQFIYIEDFVEFCEDRGIELDFSNCTSAQYALASLHTNHHGILDFSKCSGSMQEIFYSHNASWAPYNIVTIDEFISSETTFYRSDTFNNATYLTNLTMSGVIATGTFDVSKCILLTRDSLMSIINCLKDISESGATKICTIGTTNLAKLSDEEKAIATQKGWTLA